MDQWKSGDAKAIFLPTNTEEILAAYAEAIQWAQQQCRFRAEAKAKFADDVDAWLIACAKAKGLIMVTHERPALASKTSVKIPDVCAALRIPYVNTFDMLRDLHVSYHWDPRTGAA